MSARLRFLASIVALGIGAGAVIMIVLLLHTTIGFP